MWIAIVLHSIDISILADAAECNKDWRTLSDNLTWALYSVISDEIIGVFWLLYSIDISILADKTESNKGIKQ